MKTVVPLAPPILADADPEATAALASFARRASAYLTLTKPRIAVMVLITVATGYIAGARTMVYPATLLGSTLR